MAKKVITWFLVFAFLNLVITPKFIFAGEGDFNLAGSPSGESTALAIGGAILLLVIVSGIVLLAKRSSSPSEQQKDEEQETTGIVSFKNADEQFNTSYGQLALIHW
jgi:ascorbate-specific PTS system EIIC-type component UlaA